LKQDWSLSELLTHFTLMPPEFELLANKTGPNRLGFAALLKFFLHQDRFPQEKHEIPKAVIAHLALQIDVAAEDYLRFDWRGRTIKDYRSQIRQLVGFREPTVQDVADVTSWLAAQTAHKLANEDELIDLVYNRFREIKAEPTTTQRLQRLVRSVMHTFEENFFTERAKKIPDATKLELDALLGIFPQSHKDPSVSTETNQAQQSSPNLSVNEEAALASEAKFKPKSKKVKGRLKIQS